MAASAKRIKIIKGSDVTSRAIEWEWEDYLAIGKFEILAGIKGDGKTTVTLDLLAEQTKDSGRWPDDKPVKKPGGVLIWSSEDGLEDTIKPRFELAGGRDDRFNYIGGVQINNGEERPFDPATDMRDLIEAAGLIPDLRAMMIDPIVSAVSGDNNQNNNIRRALGPIVEFAEKRHCWVIGISHFNKNSGGSSSLDRFNGSLAYTALSRLVLGTRKGEEGAPNRLVRVASNIGKQGGGYEYTLVQDRVPDKDFDNQKVMWGKELRGDADALLSPEDQSAEAAARVWLANILKDGPMLSTELLKAAKAYGHAETTLRRAKKRLPIEVDGIGGGVHRKWIWRLVSFDEMQGRD
jgi:putative DNA primase/helicase